jgi:hypothetical protein
VGIHETPDYCEISRNLPAASTRWWIFYFSKYSDNWLRWQQGLSPTAKRRRITNPISGGPNRNSAADQVVFDSADGPLTVMHH